jgi:hypothetical protein
MHLAKCSVEQVTLKAFSKKGSTFAKLISCWKNFLPADLALRCFPQKISSHEESDHQINILHICSEDPYTTIFLTYNSEILIEKIAVFLGGKKINKINVKTIGS